MLQKKFTYPELEEAWKLLQATQIEFRSPGDDDNFVVWKFKRREEKGGSKPVKGRKGQKSKPKALVGEFDIPRRFHPALVLLKACLETIREYDQAFQTVSTIQVCEDWDTVCAIWREIFKKLKGLRNNKKRQLDDWKTLPESFRLWLIRTNLFADDNAGKEIMIEKQLKSDLTTLDWHKDYESRVERQPWIKTARRQAPYLFMPPAKLDTVTKDEDGLMCSSDRHGILALPQETFSGIFEILAFDRTRYYDCSGTKEVIRQLSLVSKTFKNAVYDTASLWSRIDNEYCLADGFDTRLGRSKKASLALNLVLDATREHENLLHIALPLRSRCEFVALDFPNGIPKLVGYFPNTCFSETKVLRLVMTELDKMDYNGNSSYGPLVKEWSFPNLQSFEPCGQCPPPGTFLGIQSLLVLSAGCDICTWSPMFIDILFDFLPHLNCLKHLCLHVPQAWNDDSKLNGIPAVELDTVTSLEVVLESDKCCQWFVTAFSILKLPNVGDIRFMVRFPEAPDGSGCPISTWIDRMLGSYEILKCNTVSAIGIDFHPDINLNSETLAFLLNLFPNVQYLGLRLPKQCSTSDSRKEGHCVGLHQLHLLSVWDQWDALSSSRRWYHTADSFTDSKDIVQVGINDASTMRQFSNLFTSTDLIID